MVWRRHVEALQQQRSIREPDTGSQSVSLLLLLLLLRCPRQRRSSLCLSHRPAAARRPLALPPQPIPLLSRISLFPVPLPRFRRSSGSTGARRSQVRSQLDYVGYVRTRRCCGGAAVQSERLNDAMLLHVTGRHSVRALRALVRLRSATATADRPTDSLTVAVTGLHGNASKTPAALITW